MMMIIPKCPRCKTQKYVVFRVADVKQDCAWFHIAYCTKCFSVLECHFRGKLIKTKGRKIKFEIEENKIITAKERERILKLVAKLKKSPTSHSCRGKCSCNDPKIEDQNCYVIHKTKIEKLLNDIGRTDGKTI